MGRKKAKKGGRASRSNRKSSLRGTSQTNPKAEKKSEEELMSEVFSIDMLREMIVGQVIKNEMGRGPSRNDLRAVRLVSKSWLNDASRNLLAAGQPLYKIILKEDNSLDSSPHVQQNGGKLLDQFISAMANSTNLHTKMPPFSLAIFADFFREENYLSFSNFLKGCASGLVELKMVIPENGGSLTFLFPDVHFTFPHLHTLILGFPGYRLRLEEEEMPFSSGSNLVALPFIQSILQASSKLNNFCILPLVGIESCVPLGIRRLQLPSTITVLDVTGLETNSQLECVLHFNLPNLLNLTLGIPFQPYADGLVFRILEKFRISLRKLYVLGKLGVFGPLSPLTLLRFPRMEKLETLWANACFQFEDGHPPLQHSLPNMKHLYIYSIRLYLRMWTDFSNFPNVTALSLIHFNTERRPIYAPNFNASFSNLQILEIDFKTDVDFEFLKRIFLGMRQLKKLTIGINDDSENVNVNQWDSLFTGIPVEMLAANPEFCRRIKVLEEDNLQPSISLLTELQELSLSCTSPGGPIIISDVSFQHGFMLIESLKELSLEGRFKASPEMVRTWRESGRILSPSFVRVGFDLFPKSY